ncbi:MAG: hypothetical protein ABJC12_09660 [Saprospiraceae bacterium]
MDNPITTISNFYNGSVLLFVPGRLPPYSTLWTQNGGTIVS